MFTPLRFLAVWFCIALVIATPHPSGTFDKREPTPSAFAKRTEPSLAKRVPTPSGTPHKRQLEQQVPVVDVSKTLCPFSLTACPIEAVSPKPRSLQDWENVGYECVDVENDLRSCGGCSSYDERYDCTTIENALGTSCDVGRCRVHSCARGYRPNKDGTTCIRA